MGPGGGRTRFRAVPRSARTRSPNSMPPPPSAARPRRQHRADHGQRRRAGVQPARHRQQPAARRLAARCWKTTSRRRRGLAAQPQGTARRPGADDLAGARVGPHPARGAQGRADRRADHACPTRARRRACKGGILLPCELFTSDTTGNIQSHRPATASRPAPSGDLKLGDVWAKAEGRSLAGKFVPSNGKPMPPNADADGQPALQGRAHLGRRPRSSASRPYYLLLNPASRTRASAATIAERLNSHLPRDRRPEPEGGRGEDARTDPRERADRVPAQPLPLPARRPAGADPAGAADQRLPPEARRGTARPGHHADGGGQAGGARRRQLREPARRAGKPVAVGAVRLGRSADVPGSDRRRGRTGPARRGPPGPSGRVPQGAGVDGRRRLHRPARGTAGQPDPELRYGRVHRPAAGRREQPGRPRHCW